MGITTSFLAGVLTAIAVIAVLALLQARRREPRGPHWRMLGGMQPRTLAGVLTLSAVGLVGIVASEGYTDRAVVPTQGDRPTIGFGSTFHEDGSPVRMGDTTNPARALVKAQAHISREEAVFRKSLEGVSLYQAEYDTFFDFVYQYGSGAWATSPMLRELKAGNYVPACNGLLEYRKLTSARREGPGWEVSRRDAKGNPTRWAFDCSTPGNRVCMGVWTRQQARHQKCIGAQQ